MLQRMFSGGGRAPGANLGQFQGSQGPIYTRLSRPQGAGGMGSLLAALPMILQSAPGIFKAITSDPGFQSRMQQNKQNQLATAEPTTPPTTPPSASTPTLPPTTIPPVAPTQPVRLARVRALDTVLALCVCRLPPGPDAGGKPRSLLLVCGNHVRVAVLATVSSNVAAEISGHDQRQMAAF